MMLMRETQHRTVAAALLAIVMLAAAGCDDDHHIADITPATEVPAVAEPTTVSAVPEPTNDRPRTVAKGEDVRIVDWSAIVVGPWSEFAGQTLNIDAVE